jgi:hypothetical protein
VREVKLYEHYGMKKKEPPRGTFTYTSHWEEKHRRRLLWNGIFLLGLALFGAILIGVMLIATTPVTPR